MTPERDQQIMDVFLAAVELPNDRRAGYLTDACGTDRQLRAEVESLLKHHVPETLVACDGYQTRHDGKSASTVCGRRLFPRIGMSKSVIPRPFIVTAIILAVCLTSLGYLTHRVIRDKLRQNVQSQLETVLNADVGAIEIWLAKQKQMADRWANHRHVRTTLSELARLSAEEGLTTSELESNRHHATFLDAVGPLLARPEISFVGVFSRDGHGIAKCPEPRVADVYWSSRGAALISPCFRGETIFMPTFQKGSNVVGGNHNNTQQTSVSVVAPVRSEDGHVVAAMQLVMEIDHEFAALFSMARLGETGDSYAFDERGMVLTDLRREEDLWKVGLLPKDCGAALRLDLRDPGVDLRTDPQSGKERKTRPFCKVPALAIAAGAAVDADGYRNYLGAKVVGAARWLPQYDFGVVTEIEYEEAYALFAPLTWVFGGVFGLFACASIVAVALLMKNYWLRKQVGESLELGPYTLGELVGQGGMAKVYKATHAKLRRPTAIKLIERSEAGEDLIARFEYEAQVVSELTHPNTIQIYDYGHTDNGVFYYAMEYLPGISVAELIARDGAISPARVINILCQVCASLVEAHDKGLIHRDIKPTNIMLCERGGQYDFVKVLDFGLVKNISQSDLDVTRGQDLTGTPLYISPERICRSATVDARSDIYSVATVAFALLTGEHLFDGDTSTEVLYRVANEQARRPSEVSTYKIPAQLDELVISCLAKDPQDRPSNVSVVLEILDTLASELPWTPTDAKLAWRCNDDPSAVATEPLPTAGASKPVAAAHHRDFSS